ncbi:MAG: sulfurtransferase [Castellaniella sp.]|nr:sulfurtransferase [Castellaniella sp.]
MHMISPRVLQSWLLEAQTELALLDVREAGEFGWGHLLFAVPVPYSRLEFELGRLVPRRGVQLVLYDDGQSGVAARAAERAVALGYERVSVLEGGAEGWQRAGYRLFAGVNVPSKVFGELVEETHHTPRISAQDLHTLLARGAPILVVDGRPLAEYRKMNIPGSVCCPNGELAYRISTLVEDESVPIVVNCAGRTRSIIGAQTLREIGLRNPILALENGTQGWTLAGFELEHGSTRPYPAVSPAAALAARAQAATALAAESGVRSLDLDEARRWLGDTSCTTYLLDVRTPEEFAAGAVPGAWSAPGGQLIQATDQSLAVRGARVLLIDHDGVRAPVVAQWLRRMGWDAHTVSVPLGADLGVRSGPAVAEPLMPLPPAVGLSQLEAWRRDGCCQLIDVRPSMDFRRGHIPGAVWAVRPRFDRLDPSDERPVVLVSDDLEMIRMAAQEWVAIRPAVALYQLEGGYRAWVAAGGRAEVTPEYPSDLEAIDYLFFVHDRHDGNLEAARQYLAWEQGLVAMLEPAERGRFDP